MGGSLCLFCLMITNDLVNQIEQISLLKTFANVLEKINTTT